MLAAISQFAAEAFAREHGELRTSTWARAGCCCAPRRGSSSPPNSASRAGDEARMDAALLSLMSKAPDARTPRR